MGKIKSSLSIKIFLGIAVILLVVSLTMFGILRIFMPRAYETELNARLVSGTNKFAAQLEATPKDQWENMLMSFCLENNTGAVIFDENSEQIAGFSITVYTEGDSVAAQNGSKTAMSFSAAFESGGKPYAVTSYANAGAVEQVTGIFTEVFPFVFITIIVISALAAFFYSRFLAKPIVDISNVSKRMTALDMAWRCDISRSDEIGVLAGNLNAMAARLAAALNELQTANEKLKADIDREREQDKRRRDFFSAISHELKTPVTVLKGELDGMILNVGKFKDRDKYLQEAYQTTESIEKLVREILTLAKLDAISLNVEDVSLTALADEACRTYEGLARDKHITAGRRCDEEIIVRADKKQMRTALSNIIGNAVKHSPENSIVTVCVSKESRVLSVENSGVHIEAAELPQIWEPFYRTDKSRSRDTGGNGLGLYIVKTILDNHGFEYRIENTESGIRFTIVFPL